MSLRRSPHSKRLALLAACVGVAALVAGCLPPPPPPPAPPTTTRPVPTTTTLPACPTSSAAASEQDSPPTPGSQTYTAVVKDERGRAKVVTRQVTSGADVVRFRADAASRGNVIAFAPDAEVRASAQTESWGFTDDGFRAGWTAASTTGTGVRVAVLDTGIDSTHPDLAAHLDPAPAGLDLVSKCMNGSGKTVGTPGVASDPNGHGTHVSGIIAATDDAQGVVGGAPGATIVPVRVLNSSGSGRFSDVAAGILWAADKAGGNASVISMSLGGTSDGGVVGAALATVEDPANATYTHPTVVIAAGNSSGSAPEYPGVYAGDNPFEPPMPQVLAVGALCKPGFVLSPRPGDECASTSGLIASFSSHPWIGTGSPTGVSAPGTSIVSDWPGGGTKVESGTSMATPLVAALAALVTAECGGATFGAADVVARIENTAVDLGTTGPDQVYGFGAIAPGAALSSCS